MGTLCFCARAVQALRTSVSAFVLSVLDVSLVMEWLRQLEPTYQSQQTFPPANAGLPLSDIVLAVVKQ